MMTPDEMREWVTNFEDTDDVADNRTICAVIWASTAEICERLDALLEKGDRHGD